MNKKKYFSIQISLIFIYVLFYLLMDLLFVNIQANLYAMDTYQSIYNIHYFSLNIVVFFKWFFLGVLFELLNLNDPTQIKFDFSPSYFLISVFSATFYILISTYNMIPIPSIYSNKDLIIQVVCMLATFSGFLFFKAFFSAKITEFKTF